MVSTSSFSEEQVTVSATLPVLENLPEGDPPVTDAQLLRHGGFPTQDQARIIMQQPALAQIQQHAASNLAFELGGVLLGRAYRNGGQVYVEVEAAIAAESDQHGPIHFTFTADAWTKIHQDREAQYPKLDIVGWFHTHPNLGVFFSGDDVVVHSAAFTLPWHIALVVDPVRYEGCFFGWGQDATGPVIRPINGFYEQISDPEQESGVQWQPAAHPTVWQDEPVHYHQNSELAGYVPAPPSLLPPISPWVGAILGFISLLISLYLLLFPK